VHQGFNRTVFGYGDCQSWRVKGGLRYPGSKHGAGHIFLPGCDDAQRANNSAYSLLNAASGLRLTALAGGWPKAIAHFFRLLEGLSKVGSRLFTKFKGGIRGFELDANRFKAEAVASILQLTF